ncbi:MAG: IS1595 family transposase [Deltaproteobacteria bacterium]|nr:IS1595 family transposase [Deltaproteobacteria bacterium]
MESTDSGSEPVQWLKRQRFVCMTPKDYDFSAEDEPPERPDELADELENFYAKFRDEEACRQRLYEWRWPKCFKCEKCGSREYYRHRKRGLFQCKNCGYQASLTAGTLFHRSKVKLKKWFLLIYLMIRLGKKLNLTRLQYHVKFGSSRTLWGMKRKVVVSHRYHHIADWVE